MTLQEYRYKLLAAVQQLAATQGEDALIVSLDFIGLVKLRIQTEGRDKDNAAFPKYVPAYKKVRQKRGLQTEYFDFTDTGRAWASVQPKIIGQVVGRVTVRVKPNGKDNELKAAGQFKKRGNFLLPTKEEIQIVTTGYKERRLARLAAIK